MEHNRLLVLGGLLVALSAAAVLVLASVLRVVLFAITVAYVLYPLREMVRRQGVPQRVASAVATTVAFLFVLVVAGPIVYVLYTRRTQLVEAVERIPDSVAFTISDTEVVFETAPVVDAVVDLSQELAVSLALAAPRLALEFVLFTLLVYGILYKPSSIRTAVYRLVPSRYHDVVTRLHRRTRTTLYSIYVLQAMTALGTFAVALPLFLFFGYTAPFTLAVFAGILQFIPVVGPSVLIAVLAGNDFLLGDPVQAVLIAVLGLVLVGFVPDAIIRTQLASRTGELASSLYFVGFVGGILTVGAIGLIIGPLIVALLVEVVGMLSEREAPEQSRLETAGDSEPE